MHAYVSFFCYLKDSPFHIFFDGQIAVVLFVVLSGFFYYKKGCPSVKSYVFGVRNKIFRIFPAYIISMLISYLLCNLDCTYDITLFSEWSNTFWQQKASFLELLKQLTVLWPHDANLINPPTWYIGLEVRFFLVIPLLVMMCNTKYTSWYILIPIALLLILSGRIFYATCILGCITRVIYNKLETSENLYKTKYKILILFLLLISIYLLNIRNELDVTKKIALVLQSIGAASVVLWVSIYNYKLLTNNILVYLGNISFEFYLCHFSVLLLLRSFYNDMFSYVIVSFVISILVSVIVNKISNYLVFTLRSGERNNARSIVK